MGAKSSTKDAECLRECGRVEVAAAQSALDAAEAASAAAAAAYRSAFEESTGANATAAAAEQELRELTTDLEEDAKKRPAKRLEREERDELLRRCTRLRQTIGEVKRMEKNLALKKRFNAEQKQRVAEGRRPFFVPDITKKKHAAKYRWRDAGPGARGGVDSQGSGPPHHRGRQRADD